MDLFLMLVALPFALLLGGALLVGFLGLMWKLVLLPLKLAVGIVGLVVGLICLPILLPLFIALFGVGIAVLSVVGVVLLLPLVLLFGWWC
jgi:hypothetical protein